MGKHRVLELLVGILLVGLAPLHPPRADGAWRAGGATVDITPREPIWLAGYGDCTAPSEGVLLNIHAKALALEGETGTRTVLVTSDLLGFTKDVPFQKAHSRACIPSLRVLKEGGYEGGGAMIPYNLPAPFAEPVEEVIAGKVDELVHRTGEAR